ncbi:AEC family transporter [Acidomonas methanolica]|uniref:Transporter n=1 Tax=Acidomonas methanolica NBRC 104435 TaxID=1231351 RepID=A0A023D7S4_ACIMT|nr:AEC family transporter [Acidomonas methanolica]MBU2653766.1 AEC family transporter [Acidomonas methanolica]TCS31719.1 hypothetical protein EDC31_102271 [Acidomonas methanolica]GAJ30183.1 transporter [Acidomonas methanolica NBRC 104435]GBQ56376.1 putative permease [Acidomonas methanolica]GEK98135.1 hypothetical protein AME01nite_06340 [Acidomonas methanolica NBRC 104435]
MNEILTLLIPIFGLIAFGYVTALRNWLGANATTVLNRFVLRLALPAELFQITATLPLSDLRHAGFTSAFALGMMATFALGWIWDWGRPATTAHRLSGAAIEGLAAGYANTAFMGIPICLSVFGAHVNAALTISNLLTVCLLMAGVILLIEIEEQEKTAGGSAFGRVMKGLALNPLVFAPLAGLAWNAAALPLPAGISRFMTMLGDSASPCALVTIGLFLAETRDQPAPFGAVLRVSLLKLFVQPLLTVLAAIYLFALPTLWVEEALVLSALPTGTGPFMLAQLYDREAAIASRATLLTTIVSIVTLAGILAWIGPHPAARAVP